MTEHGGVSLSILEEEKRRLQLLIAQCDDFAQKANLAGQLLKITMQAGKVKRDLRHMTERMHEAGDAAQGRWDLKD